MESATGGHMMPLCLMALASDGDRDWKGLGFQLRIVEDDNTHFPQKSSRSALPRADPKLSEGPSSTPEARSLL